MHAVMNLLQIVIRQNLQNTRLVLRHADVSDSSTTVVAVTRSDVKLANRTSAACNY
jgi:hypothetical protein